MKPHLPSVPSAKSAVKNKHRLALKIRLRRMDHMPAFGAFLRCEPPCSDNPEIWLNVQAIMDPEPTDESGEAAPLTRADIRRNIITVLMHEFGHALESHFRVPVNERAIERATMDWERQFAAVKRHETRRFTKHKPIRRHRKK